MKPNPADRLRSSLTQKLLDISDGWAQYKSYLQVLRETQREDAERAYKGSRPPEGTGLEFLLFQMTEVFHFENFGEMKKGLLSLFPNSKGFPDFGRLATDIDRYTHSISHFGWTRLGVIARDRIQWVGMPIDRYMPELPEEVRYIELSMHMLTFSVAMVVFEVHLNEKATQQLIRLQNRSYLSSIRLKSLIPVGKNYIGASSTMPESEMRQAIVGWLDGLRENVEDCLRGYIDGHFMHSKSVCSRLPAVEVFAISGIEKNGRNLEEWKKAARGWAESFAFDLSVDPFENEKYIVNQSMDRYGSTVEPPRNNHVSRLLVLSEKAFQSVNMEMYGGSENLALAHEAHGVLEELTPFSTFVNLLDSIESDFCQIRPKAFGIIRRRSRLSHTIEVRGQVQRFLMLIQRMEMESGNLKRYYRNQMSITGAMINHSQNTVHFDTNLAGYLLQSTERKFGYIGAQLEYADKWLSGYVETRNMEAMYRLQRGTFWLTLVLLVLTLVLLLATVLQVISSWSQLVTSYPKVVQFLMHLWDAMRAFLKF